MISIVGLVLAIASSSALDLEVLKISEQPADGSTSFDYFAPETKSVAESLLKFGADVDDALREYTTSLKRTNNASLALDKFNEAVNSVEGTNCAVSEENGNELSEVQSVIESVITTCAEYVPRDYRDVLQEKTTESLVKVQDIDNALKLNSMVCTSLRVTSTDCVTSREEALARLNDVLSYEEEAKFIYYTSTAFYSSIENIDDCLQGATQYIIDDINERINAIEQCKSA